MILLAIDPSSTKTGYAVMVDRVTLLDAGFLKPGKTRNPAIMRIKEMIEQLVEVLDEWQPGKVLIESPSAHVNIGRHHGAGAGLAVYGFAAGAIWAACCARVDTKAIDAQLWTCGVPKLKRQKNICMAFPQQYNPEKDRGGDIADAIGLACWWFGRQKAKRLAG